MIILQFFGGNSHISMGDDKTSELAWIYGYSSDTMSNGTLHEEADKCTI